LFSLLNKEKIARVHVSGVQFEEGYLNIKCF
jgi:hypothetical protein